MLYIDIKKKLGDFTLDIGIETNKETLALFGASGCGKTVNLKCVAGIEKPDEGEIVLNDKILFSSKKKINLPPQKRNVGLLFQSYALFPNMTLEENIAISIPKNCPNKDKIIKEKISEFSLEGLETNYPHELSGGQQQRTALARMLVNEPEILMLDEPFSALDEHLRWKLEQRLITTLRDYGRTALYVSHNKDEVYRIADKIAIYNQGSIKAIGGKQEIFNRPGNVNAAKLIGCNNISRAKKIDKNRVYAIDWDLELESGEAVQDGLKYIGIYGNNLDISSDMTSKNTFLMEIINKIENPFSDTLVLKHERNESTSYNSYIYLEINSKESLDVLSLKEPIYVHFKKENLLLLY